MEGVADLGIPLVGIRVVEGREGGGMQTLGRFYLAVVQAMLIFRLEMWMMNPIWQRHWVVPPPGVTTDHGEPPLVIILRVSALPSTDKRDDNREDGGTG